MHRICALTLLLTLAMPAAADADGQVIVKYRKGASSKKRRLSVESVGGAVLGAVRGQGARIVAVTGDAAGAAARLARKPGVAWAEPDYELHALAAPDDPLLAQLGGLGLIHAQAGWDALGLSESYPADGGTPVAIVDTGIDPAPHEDLAGKVVACGSSRHGD